MATAFEIEAQVNIRGQRSLDAGPAEVMQSRTTAWPDHYVDTGQCNEDNYDCTLKEVLLFHRQKIFTLFQNAAITSSLPLEYRQLQIGQFRESTYPHF